MSAYVVDRGHIRYLVNAGLSQAIRGRQSGPLRWRWNRNLEARTIEIESLTAQTADRVGQMLWDENIASINARYPDTIESPEGMPGPIGENYQYGPHQNPTSYEPTINPLQVLSSLFCFEYQACEHDGWEGSEAFAFCESLRKTAIYALPGMDDLKWGAPAPIYNREDAIKANAAAR